jgi:hypothetical protein
MVEMVETVETVQTVMLYETAASRPLRGISSHRIGLPCLLKCLPSAERYFSHGPAMHPTFGPCRRNWRRPIAWYEAEVPA